MRGRYEGALNVVRFNWTKYALGLAVTLTLLAFSVLSTGSTALAFTAFAALALTALLTPLWVSHLVYDRSSLYRMEWLDELGPQGNGIVLNINAGFDETSQLLKERFKECTLHSLDFYDPKKHTEPSIERARQNARGPAAAMPITASHIPFESSTVDRVLCFLSLHEVRDPHERLLFLAEIHRVLKPEGRLLVTEHLRDGANFLAFNFGFLHFHARSTWVTAFRGSGFILEKEVKTTPFISTFVLRPS